MKAYFKMNVLLRVLTVVMLGYYTFEILFSILTGNFGMYGNVASKNAHHSSSSTSSIYSYDVIINTLLLLLVKLLIVIFFLVLIMGASRLMRVIWNREENKNNKSYLYSKNARTLLMVIGSFVGIMILYSIFEGFYMIPTEYSGIGWNNNKYFYNNNAIKFDDFFWMFFNLLLYIPATILGIEVFNYFIRKQKKMNNTVGTTSNNYYVQDKEDGRENK